MVPEHLRPHLERLGARITPADPGQEVVHVPGADFEYKFDHQPSLTTYEHGVRTRPAGTDQQWFHDAYATGNSLDDTPYRIHRVLNEMSRGSINHEGPHHSLMLDQWYHPGPMLTEGRLHHTGIFSHDLDDSEMPDHREHQVEGEGHSDEAAMVRGAFIQRPNHFLHPLLDLLAEKHGHRFHILPEVPHQYSRELENHYHRDIEELL